MISNSLRRCIILSLIVMYAGIETKAYSFSCSWLSPYAWAESTHVKSFGAQDASPYYQEKMHEFLTYLTINQAEQIKVRALKIPLQLLQENVAFDKFLGISLWTGIWLDESKLEKLPEEERLWVMALEAAKYKLNIAQKNVVVQRMLPWIAGMANVACVAMSAPLLNQCPNNMSKLVVVVASGFIGVRLSLAFYSTLIQKWYSRYREWQQEAKKMAIQLLNEHGYANIVEKHMVTEQSA